MAKKIMKDLPHNLGAEKAVIGSAFISKNACLDVVNSLNEEEFYDVKNQIIFRYIKTLSEKNKAVDVLTVTEELINAKELDNVGGVSYLQECSDSIATIASLNFYIEIVQKQAVLRNFLLAIRDIDDKYKTEELDDIDDFLSGGKEKIEKVLEKRRISSFQTTGEVVKIVKAKMEKLADSDNTDGVIGLTTGYDRLNHYTQGFKDGELIIVAARPNVGKTALCLNFAYKAATVGKKAVGIFSLEMNKELLVQRLLGIAGCVPLSSITSGKIRNTQDRLKLSQAIDELSQTKIYIDDTPGMRLTDIITKSRKLQVSEPNLGLLIVDYLGLVQTANNGRNQDSRQEEVRKISLAFKQLARDLHIPIVLVSQLSRKVEDRDNKKPMMSDLRDSGNIEQDADIILLLYRQDYYEKKENPAGLKKGAQLSNQEKFDLARETKEKQLGQQVPGNASYVEVNVAKNRNGATGKAALFFYRDFGKFDAPSKEWEEAMEQVAREAGLDD